ncbi:unnamed protein product [Scytosiphon promiscuus]
MYISDARHACCPSHCAAAPPSSPLPTFPSITNEFWHRRRFGDLLRKLHRQMVAGLIIIYLVFGIATVGARWRYLHQVFRAFDGRSPRRRRLCRSADFTCAVIVILVAWPLFIGQWLLTCLFLTAAALLQPLRNLHWPRTARHRSEQARQDAFRLRNKSRSWADRGWLVMLRVRYMRSLERIQNTPWRPSFRIARKGKTKRRPFKLDVISRTHAAVAEDVELGEVSGFDLEFAKVVAHITEIGEEGLFRQVISFI